MSKLDPFCPGCHSASLRRQAADPVEPCLSGVPGVTDWLKNVLARGSATIVTKGHSYEVDRPEVISMADVTGYFRPRSSACTGSSTWILRSRSVGGCKLTNNGAGR